VAASALIGRYPAKPGSSLSPPKWETLSPNGGAQSTMPGSVYEEAAGGTRSVEFTGHLMSTQSPVWNRQFAMAGARRT